MNTPVWVLLNTQENGVSVETLRREVIREKVKEANKKLYLNLTWTKNVGRHKKDQKRII